MLQSLPDEALVCVFSFIDGKHLITNVSLTCKRFRSVISSEWYWKRRFKFICKKNEEMIADLCPHVNEDIRGLQTSCIETEYVKMICDKRMGFMKTEKLTASSGGIDCVQLLHPDMNRTEVVLAAGSRDHIIYLWKKRVRDEGARVMREYISSELPGHMGWVWCLASHASNQGILASGSWDHEVRLWDISHGQCVRHFRKIHKAAVLCMSFPEPHLLLTGSHDKSIKVFDLRDKNPNASNVGLHSKAVLSLASESTNRVFTSSEDKTVTMWDLRRPNEEVSKLKCTSSVNSICLNYGVLSVGFGTTVRLLDTSQGSLVVKDEFDSGHATPLTSVYHNLGMIVTGSKDKSARIHSMTTPHTCLETFSHSADVTDVHYRRGILAIGSSDRTVSLWIPKNL